jgi:hypothetical protein
VALSRRQCRLALNVLQNQAGFFSFDPDTRRYCMITVPAPWRDNARSDLATDRRHCCGIIRREMEEKACGYRRSNGSRLA